MYDMLDDVGNWTCEDITLLVNGEDVPSADDVLAYVAWVNEEEWE